MSNPDPSLAAQLAQTQRILQAKTEACTAAERRLTEARADAKALAAVNERLNQTLRDSREALVELRDRLERLDRPPTQLAVVVQAESEDGTALVSLSGRILQVAVALPDDAAPLTVGESVGINEAMTAVNRIHATPTGDVVRIVEVLEDGRMLVATAADDESVVLPAADLDLERLRPGVSVRVDRRAGIAFEVLSRVEVTDLVLEDIPDVSWDDIGGLAAQVEQVRDAVELPFKHRDLFAEFGLAAPKGVLLYGPPGCGKTMMAKAVAQAAGSSFLNIKGPELLNKYVGETERQIRQIFARAREIAEAGRPVVVFFDEMDALFRTRGSGVSSDMESTVVPQFLSELDGVETLEHVIVIGATNREDLIDPAILRAGRLDVKVRLSRPDRDGAADILAKYLTCNLPFDAAETDAAGGVEALVADLIDATIEALFARTCDNEFVEVTYASGAKEVLYAADFVSGAMLANVVNRARTAAIKQVLAGGSRGIQQQHLIDACRAEIAENEDMASTTNPDDWARVSGRRGEPIAYLRTLHGSRQLDWSSR